MSCDDMLLSLEFFWRICQNGTEGIQEPLWSVFMISKHLENAITHILSQMIGRSVPAPHPEPLGIFEDDLFDRYSLSDIANWVSQIVYDGDSLPA